MKQVIIGIILSTIIVVGHSQSIPSEISAENSVVSYAQQQFNPESFIVDTIVGPDGDTIFGVTVPGKPVKGVVGPLATPTETSFSLSNTPAYDWSFGCSATAAAMMAGYYDNNGFSNMYSGPTNGGIAPLTNAIWGSVLINGETRKLCPLSATRMDLDGRTTFGHVDDYWISYGNNDPDPYVGNWTQHTYGDCTADYMKTNQSAHNNSDGSTRFYYYSSGNPGSFTIDDDGCYGAKLFFESRGYTVNDYYTQLIDGYNGNTLGFTYEDYVAEIDAGRPVLLHVTGHTMLGYGYDDATDKVYLHDTWDYSDHEMTWGGDYSGLTQWGVSVLELADVVCNLSITSPTSGETWIQGISQTVSWTSNCPDEPVKIELFKEGSLLSTLAFSTANDGEFNWVVPGDIASGCDYQVKIYILSDPGTYGLSDEFCIGEPGLTILSPTVNTMWTQGNYYEVLWQSSIASSETLRVQLYKGGIWQSNLAYSTTNDGQFIWTVPGSMDDDCDYQIKIFQISDPSIYDVSTEFCIGTPIVTFVNPIKGITWQQGEYYPIKWMSTVSSSEPVRLQLWKGGSLYSTLAFNTSNDGLFNWVTPASIPDGCDYQLKIYQLSDPEQFGVSEVFCFGDPSITVHTPSQLATWNMGHFYSITWSSTLSPAENVSIELIKDGTYDRTLAFVTDNDGVFVWTVPTDLLETCDYQVRVESNVTPTDFGISKLFCIGGLTDFSGEIGQMEKSQTAPEGSFKLLELSISPNPAKQNININTKNLVEGKLQISIYNIYGQKVWDKCQEKFDSRHSVTYNAGLLHEGMYMVVVVNNDRMVSKKFLKGSK